MAKEVTYTSTSISKTHLALINEMKQYVADTYNVNVTSQQINDFAIDLLRAQRDKLKELADAQVVDPDVRAYLRMQEKLRAAGKLPK